MRVIHSLDPEYRGEIKTLTCILCDRKIATSIETYNDLYRTSVLVCTPCYKTLPQTIIDAHALEELSKELARLMGIPYPPPDDWKPKPSS